METISIIYVVSCLVNFIIMVFLNKRLKKNYMPDDYDIIKHGWRIIFIPIIGVFYYVAELYDELF